MTGESPLSNELRRDYGVEFAHHANIAYDLWKINQDAANTYTEAIHERTRIAAREHRESEKRAGLERGVLATEKEWWTDEESVTDEQLKLEARVAQEYFEMWSNAAGALIGPESPNSAWLFKDTE